MIEKYMFFLYFGLNQDIEKYLFISKSSINHFMASDNILEVQNIFVINNKK